MMKTVPTKKTHRLLTVFAGLTTLSLAFIVPHTVHASDLPSPMQPASAITSQDTLHSIQVSKSQNSKKSRIRLYPDARQQVLFFSAGGDERKVYQLYLFDMDGRLVNQASIRSKETTVLTNITEGNYLFEVFSDDERIDNGQVAVR